MIKGLILQIEKVGIYDKKSIPEGFELFCEDCPMYDAISFSCGFADFYRKVITDINEIMMWFNRLNEMHNDYHGYHFIGYIDENDETHIIQNWTGEVGKKGLTW